MKRRWYSRLFSPLLAYLCLALIVRVWLVVHTNGVIDGDESIVGIQAEHILHGELPIYFYGQPYMGSLEAYLVALLFAVVGPSVWALRAEPILLSLVIVWLTWKFAGMLAELAHLPNYARRYFMHIAALFAAIPPLYDTILEMRALGGYVEMFVLILLLLLTTLQLLRRWSEGARPRELIAYWAYLGLLVGLGFWVNPLILFAVVTVGVWIVGYWARALRESMRMSNSQAERGRLHHSPNIWKGDFSLAHNILLTLIAIPAALIGSFPAIYWGAFNHWDNVWYLLSRGGSTRVAAASNLAKNYMVCISPQVLGGAILDENMAMSAWHMLPVALGLGCAAAILVLVGASFFWRTSLLQQIRSLAALPLLFGLFNAFFFCIGTGAIDCRHDYVTRYGTPMMLVLPFYVATVFVGVVLWLYERQKAKSSTNIIKDEYIEQRGEGLRAGNGEPLPHPKGRDKSRPYERASLGNLRGIVVGGLLVVLLWAVFAQVVTYGLTDAGYTFQSPSCSYAPASNDAIIAYMQREHIRYAWGISWIGYPIVFKTNERIIIADPRPVLNRSTDLGRIPAYVVATKGADRPSMLAFIQHGDTHPLLLRTLDTLGIMYRSAVFPSEPGVDILLVTPINQTVPLMASSAFLKIFAPC